MRLKLSHLPRDVARPLRAFYRRRRAFEFLRWALASACVYAVLALVAMHLDRLLFLGDRARLSIAWTVHVSGMLYTLALLAMHALRRRSVSRVAYEMEDRLSGAALERFVTLDGILSGAQPEGNAVHADLVAQLTEETVAQGRDLQGAKLVRDRRLRVLEAVFLALTILCTLLTVPPSYQFDLMVRRFLFPRANLPKPGFVHLSVSPGDTVIGRGGDVLVRVEVSGGIPRLLRWPLKQLGISQSRCLVAVGDGQGGTPAFEGPTAHRMSRVQRGLFLFSRAGLEQSFSYRVRCGDAQTRVYLADVVAQPAITNLLVAVTPPPYTRLPAELLDGNAETFRLYAGSEVVVTFTVDQPVPTRTLLVGGKEDTGLEWDDETRSGRYTFAMGRPADMELRVVNEHGFANVRPSRLLFRPREDEKPVVLLDAPPSDFSSASGELVPVEVRAEDDLGVTEMAIQYRVNPDVDPDAPFKELTVEGVVAGERQVTVSTVFDLDKTGAMPGDEVYMQLRVRDTAGNDGLSRPVSIRIVPFARGENERRRLGVLSFVSEALPLVAEDADVSGYAIDPERYGQLVELAPKFSASLGETPSLESLLDLLAMEHHFTDLPRHKTDVRRLDGLLRATAAELVPAEGGPTDMAGKTNRAERLRWIADELLPPLTQGRRLKNVTWRLFGLGYEIERIHAELAEVGREAERRDSARTRILTTFAGRIIDAVREDAELPGLEQAQAAAGERLTAAIEATARAEDDLMGMGMGVQPAVAEDTAEIVQLREAVKEAKGAVTERLTQTALGAATVIQGDADTATARLRPQELVAFGEDVARRAAQREVPPADVSAAALAGAGSAAEQSSGPAASPSLQRRIALYLATVEDVGGDLLTLAAGAPGLDADVLTRLQGEVNGAAYYVGKGSAKKRIASCEKVRDELQKLLATVQPALPGLLARERDARATLAAAHANVLADIATRIGDPASPRGPIAEMRKWLWGDLLMAGHNPFAPPWLRVRDVILLRETATPGGASDLSGLLQRGAYPDDGVLTDVGRLAFLWEAEAVRELERVSDAERRLALLLVAYESALSAEHMPPAVLAAREQAILALDLRAESAPAAVDIGWPAGAAAASPTHRPAARVTAFLDGRDRELGMKDVAELGAGIPARIEALEAALAEGGDQVREMLEGVSAAAAERSRALEALVEIVSLGVAVRLDGGGDDAARDERLLLTLREALGRYAGRSAAPLAALRGAAHRELAASDLSVLRGDLMGLRAAENGLARALEKPFPEDGEDASREDETARKYPLMSLFRETREFAETAKAIRDAGDPVPLVREFLKGHPEAGIGWLAARDTLVEEARRNLASAAAALEAEQPDAGSAGASVAHATQVMGQLRDAISRAGEGEFQERLASVAGEILGRLARIKPDAGASDVDRKTRLFALGETLNAVDHLLALLRSPPGAAAEPGSRFSGGPVGIWEDSTRRHAEHSRRRLLAQVETARKQTVAGILEALESEPDPALHDRAVAWGLLLYRVVRSPLTGPVVARPPRTSGEGQANPLIAWLLQEIEEARKETRKDDTLRHYPAVTREMVDSMADFLRY